MKRVFVTDCEGPISKNDNAFEIAANFIPNGDKLFANISKYDDVLADVLHKLGYSAGSTLKLILPFFKAYSIADKQMEEFSTKNILLIADSRSTLHHIKAIAPSFIVSTSYEHYIRALCTALDFSFKNTYCTKVRIDKIGITPKEKEQLKEIAQEITQMQRIEIPTNAKTLKDFSNRDQETISRLDEIFWKKIPKMFVGKFLEDVVTVGGEQKAESIIDATKRQGEELSDVMYVGDSITDVEAFKMVHDNEGLTVSFNGNSYAVRNAEIAVLAESNLVVAVLADLFSKSGRENVLEVLQNWDEQTLKDCGIDSTLLKHFLSVYPNGLPKAQIVTTQNMETLVKESSEFRKKVRGVAIGRLG